MSLKPQQADIELYRLFQKSPLLFIEKAWGLKPQPIKPEYKEHVELYPMEEWEASWFEPWIKGKHLTWQQWIFFRAFEMAIRGEAPKKIAVESGVGTGKSSSLAMLILWFLFCHKDAQVPCTAPTGDQMYNALWKETNLWLGRMPEKMQGVYEWSTNYIRIKERAETWYARARTASKDKPEALAGVHSDFVLAVIDEASGVLDEVFQKGEGVLAGKYVFVVMISQHTRLVGYFHDAFNSDSESWQNYRFNSEDSPIVDRQFVQRILDKDGIDSDRYRIEVLGQPPKSDGVDDKGYLPLFTEADLLNATDKNFIGKRRLALDPAGEGSDNAEWAIRDAFKVGIVASEEKSTPKGMAQKTVTLSKDHGVGANDTTIDGFGLGSDVAIELTSIGFRPGAPNVGDEAEDKEKFVNIRAEAYWRFRAWVKQGGMFINLPEWKKELLSIRYTREHSGKIKIMSKKEMKKSGYASPNKVDAGMLTFIDSAPLFTPPIDDFEEVEERFDRYEIT